MNGITQSTALWYASRATGVVSLLLLTLVVVLGVLVSKQGRLPGLPSFAVTGLHRSLSLLAACFVAAHVLTAVADPYVTIGLAALIIPFVSPYQTFWLGLGTVALDLALALIVTSLARSRMPRHAWRLVHWLAYAAWPLALAHSLGMSGDLHSGALADLAVGCALAAAGAAIWRLSQALRTTPRPQRAAAALVQAQQADGRRIPRRPGRPVKGASPR
jgi:sulfoxide reductase heme-binding subunit YedZ